MRIPKVSTAQKQAVNEMYNAFTRNCIGQTKDTIELKDEFLRLNKEYTRNHMGHTFLFNAEKLSNHLLKKGHLNLANVFISELGKIYLRIGDVELAEKTIKKSIKISTLLNDKLHVLARLNELEYLYRGVHFDEKLYKTLKAKEKCALEIIENYDKCAKNFNSIMRAPTSLESVKKQLAFTYSDMADMLLETRPGVSLKLTKQAKAIYEELGQQKEVNFLEVKVKIIEKRIRQKMNSRV